MKIQQFQLMGKLQWFNNRDMHGWNNLNRME